MSRAIILDTGVLGLLTHPTGSPDSERCVQWLSAVAAGGALIVLPEITDYELRREALRTRRVRVIRRLDALKQVTRYEPITTAAMLEAARLWAWVRNQGQPTADPHALDGDVILAGQVTELNSGADQVVIATTNVRHLALFASAQLWSDIPPSP